MMEQKTVLKPLAMILLVLEGGVNGLAPPRTRSNHILSSHRPHQDPMSRLPLSYATDSTRIGIDLQATMPQNMTFPVFSMEEQHLPSNWATTAGNNNIVTRMWRKVKGAMKFDRQNIAKMGIDFGLTYNMISNINGSVTLSTAWYIACMKTGLSPLAPGQWKSLLAAYASLYVVAALIRPLRIALAIPLTHKMEQLLQYMQNRIGCTRTSAIGMVFASGIVLWLTLCAAGVTLASALAGVPLWKYA